MIFLNSHWKFEKKTKETEQIWLLASLRAFKNCHGTLYSFCF